MKHIAIIILIVSALITGVQLAQVGSEVAKNSVAKYEVIK